MDCGAGECPYSPNEEDSPGIGPVILSIRNNDDYAASDRLTPKPLLCLLSSRSPHIPDTPIKRHNPQCIYVLDVAAIYVPSLIDSSSYLSYFKNNIYIYK